MEYIENHDKEALKLLCEMDDQADWDVSFEISTGGPFATIATLWVNSKDLDVTGVWMIRPYDSVYRFTTEEELVEIKYFMWPTRCRRPDRLIPPAQRVG